MEFNMTKFTKENLSYHGGYLHYQPHTDNYYEGRKFVARFKHRGPVTKAKFVKTLIKHYTVEDYFTKLDAGRAPLQILMDDGHLIFDGKFFFLEGKIL
jgi:hypothetical protein